MHIECGCLSKKYYKPLKDKLMKQLLTLFLVTTSLFCFSQKNDINQYRCPCAKIGLDSLWADKNKVSCFSIPVNKNSASKQKSKYFLAVAIAKAGNNSLENPLLYLHGGPGIATLENLPRYLKSATWKLIREKRDLIFFDYRGTGFSQPSLCSDLQNSINTFSRTNPSSQEKAKHTDSLYRDCRSKLLAEGTDLATFSSFQLAADAEEIRKALKIPDWSIYGVSHGTTIGLNLLRSFPSKINSIILDSPYPPNAPWFDFVRPFDTCFDVLEKNVLSDPIAGKRFRSLRKDFVSAVKRLNNKPVVLISKNKYDSVLVEYKYDGDDFAWSIWSAMLSPRSIPYVPLAIHEIATGNDSILQQWSTALSSPDAHGKFSQAQSKAILCFEGRPLKAEDTERSLLLKYPDFASFNSGYPTDICNIWRPDIANKDIFKAVVSKKPVLILSGEYDPVCPPYFGAITSQTLPNSTFIVVPSASHAAIHADDCMRTMANDFISNPKKKPSKQCAENRVKIKFIAQDLSMALKNYNDNR